MTFDLGDERRTFCEFWNQICRNMNPAFEIATMWWNWAAISKRRLSESFRVQVESVSRPPLLQHPLRTANWALPPSEEEDILPNIAHCCWLTTSLVTKIHLTVNNQCVEPSLSDGIILKTTIRKALLSRLAGIWTNMICWSLRQLLQPIKDAAQFLAKSLEDLWPKNVFFT